MIRWVHIFLSILLSVTSYSQVTTSVQLKNDSVSIGQPVEVIFRINIPGDCVPAKLSLPDKNALINKLYEQDSSFFEKSADWLILDPGKWKNIDPSNEILWSDLSPEKTEDGFVIQNTIKIGIYNPGIFIFPSPAIECTGIMETINGQSAVITVSLPPGLAQQDSVFLEPIRDIITEPMNVEDVLPWFYALLAVTLVVIFIWYLNKRKKKVQPVASDEELTAEIVPAHEKAFNALYELKEKQLWQQGLIKEYQSRLTQIIRQYIEDRYQIPALELTTNEIIFALDHSGLNAAYKQKLSELLTIADLVKFAIAKPDDDVHERFFDMAVDFVNYSKNLPQ
jgi:hypothetical protein